MAYRLKEEIRPATLAFGTLTDGFLPFEVPADRCDGAEAETTSAAHTIKLASVVMKAVQVCVLPCVKGLITPTNGCQCMQ